MRQLKKILAALPHARLRRGLRFGVGAAIEHTDVIVALPILTLVDLGANVGQFSLLVRQRYPLARILAFEPLAKPAAVYRQVFADDSLVTLYQCAVGASAEMRDMNVSRHSDSSSLLPITQTQVAFAPGTEAVGRECVCIAPLSDMLSIQDIAAPALLKIDVQGYELIALEGCERLLSAFGHVYVELSFIPFYEGQALAHEVIEWLATRGFKLAGIHNPVYDKTKLIVQADFLFARIGRG